MNGARDMAKKSQVEGFRETARALGCDESEERFNQALKRVARHESTTNKQTRELSGEKHTRKSKTAK
jgi:hypothetical protein